MASYLSRAACILAVMMVAAAMMVATVPLAGQDTDRQHPIGPVYDEPHHRQIFQYEATRLLDLQLPTGDISWFHTHESPVLYVTLSTSQIRTQNLGEEWGGGGARGGAGRGAAPQGPPPAPRATSTTSYAERPITHRLENIGDGLLRAMVVVNETGGDDATSETAAGFDAKPELTNKWFRAYRVALEAGRQTSAHVHRTPVVIIQATGGRAVGTGGMTWEFNEPGQWAFFDAGSRHEIRNTGEGRVELIEVEVRGVPSPRP